MHVIVKAKSVYGRTLYYVQGEDAEPIKALTGKTTVTIQDIEALRALGHGVTVIDL